jgi:hypothetical protein
MKDKSCLGSHTIEDKVEDLDDMYHELDKKIIVIETNLKHTLQNKHAEALATARAIDLKSQP